MSCPHCGATIDGAPEFCPACGAGQAQADVPAQGPVSQKASTGSLVTAFFGGVVLGIGLDIVLLIAGAVIVAGIQSAFGNACTGQRLSFAVTIAIAVAIPVVAVVRSYKKPAKDGLFWAGLVLATFVPFMPCSIALVQSTVKC